MSLATGHWSLFTVLLLSSLVPCHWSLPFLEAQPQAAGAARPVQFTNVTKAAGIEFVHFKGNKGGSTILEEAGPGVCAGDYDVDGFTDFYIVSGRDLYNRGISAGNALFHNNGDGTFSDVTEKAGVSGSLYGLGCVGGTTTTMASRISTSRNTGRTSSIATIATEPSPT